MSKHRAKLVIKGWRGAQPSDAVQSWFIDHCIVVASEGMNRYYYGRSIEGYTYQIHVRQLTRKAKC